MFPAGRGEEAPDQLRRPFHDQKRPRSRSLPHPGLGFDREVAEDEPEQAGPGRSDVGQDGQP